MNISQKLKVMIYTPEVQYRPWKMMGLEDKPFLLGFGKFSGASC